MTQPNILIVMTDHQRGDTVLAEHPTVTPNLDAFAREGVTFTSTFCPSPHCCPARASFHSGLYPSRHGVWNNICNRRALSRGLNEDVRLFSEDLVDAGYRLHWSGKWHVSIEESPADRGWTEHFVSAHLPGIHGERWGRYRELAATPEPTERGEGEILRPGYGKYRMYGERVSKPDEHDERTVAEALAAFPRMTSERGPWCMFVGLVGPHDPYVAPKRFLDLYDLDDVTLPVSYADDLADKPRVYQRMRRQVWDQLSEREIREGIRHFRACCSYLDDKFGLLLEALERSGQADDTLVLYTSDHGDYCAEHGLFAKGIPAFRGAYHVPAVVRWPRGVKEPGRRVDALVSLADFAPTFTELAGGTPADDLAGRSLTPWLRGETPADWRDAICTQCDGVELYYTQRSVQTHDFKYVFNGFDLDELYDLRRDPHEMRNLAADATFDDVKHALIRRMWRFAESQDDTAINGYITTALAPWGPAEAFRET
ncbi:MAG TPA: sulfatase-like hydrolase/transferase [Planctomycetota bacterium]|nr:sulfatase-like hydrolase/transferase [Planctomycetota bacterium]